MADQLTPWSGRTAPPVAADKLVVMQLRCGRITNPHAAGKFIWTDRGQAGDVVAWRPA
jgi:hypothetical protein